MSPRGPRDPAVTSRMMARVRSRDSKAELALRRELHQRGVRYRLHAGDVPGRPDLTWRHRKVAVFVDGDLWHMRPGLPQMRGRTDWADLFPSRTEWWLAKLARNQARDREVEATLTARGWTVVRLWESDVLADPAGAADRVITALRAKGRPAG